jgi:hypothetical protein
VRGCIRIWGREVDLRQNKQIIQSQRDAENTGRNQSGIAGEI